MPKRTQTERKAAAKHYRKVRGVSPQGVITDEVAQAHLEAKDLKVLPDRIFVVCSLHHQGVSWAVQQGFSPRQVDTITGPEHLFKLRGTTEPWVAWLQPGPNVPTEIQEYLISSDARRWKS